MNRQMFDLRGKVAIVTGGNGGIGLGLARGLADAGANIAIVGRNEAKSRAAAEDLASRGVQAISIVADVTDKAAVARMIERATKDLGRIDVLINNAGINVRKPPHVLEIEEWESVIDTNLTSAFLCSKAVYPTMKAAGDALDQLGVAWRARVISAHRAGVPSPYRTGGFAGFPSACTLRLP